MSRIETTFKSLDRPALVTFITAGDPDIERSLEIMKALPEAGADIIELGMPFTDPMADGPVIQSASERALKAGMSLTKTLEMVKTFRAENTETPIVLMGYFNPVFIYGLEKFAKDASEAGVDGLIIVDAPPEESESLQSTLKIQGIDFIRLITPTTDEARLTKILEGASGFLYYVSITGTTGSTKPDPELIKPHLEGIRSATDLPIAVGFGIKTPEDAAAFGQIADGIIVGSVLVQTIADNSQATDLHDKIGNQVQALSSALK